MAKYGAMVRSPEVWMNLQKLIHGGDARAIKLYAELCDRVSPAEASNGDASSREVESVRRELFGNEE